MRADDRRLGLEPTQVFEQCGAVTGMTLHDVELLICERPWLSQDPHRHLQLADVVHQAGDGEPPHSVWAKTQPLAHSDRETRHTP